MGGIDIGEATLVLRVLLNRDELVALIETSRASVPEGDIEAAASAFFGELADSEIGRYLLGDD